MLESTQDKCLSKNPYWALFIFLFFIVAPDDTHCTCCIIVVIQLWFFFLRNYSFPKESLDLIDFCFRLAFSFSCLDILKLCCLLKFLRGNSCIVYLSSLNFPGCQSFVQWFWGNGINNAFSIGSLTYHD